MSLLSAGAIVVLIFMQEFDASMWERPGDTTNPGFSDENEDRVRMLVDGTGDLSNIHAGIQHVDLKYC